MRAVAVLAVLSLLAAIPAESAAQTSPTENRGWFAFGLGGGVFGRSGGPGGVAELAFQRGPHLLALRSSGGGEFLGDGVTDVGLLYGRATTGEGWHSSAAIGLGWVGATKDCGLFSSECSDESTVGVLIAAERSFRPSRFFGVGVQTFGNLNPVRSFIGVALVLKLGSLR